MASIHEAVEDPHAAGPMNKRTMGKFDAMCLTPIPRLKPRQILLRTKKGALAS
jgi:putative transcriptional regulator